MGVPSEKCEDALLDARHELYVARDHVDEEAYPGMRRALIDIIDWVTALHDTMFSRYQEEGE